MTITLSLPTLVSLIIGVVLVVAFVVAAMMDYHQTQESQSSYFPVVIAHRTITVIFIIVCFACVMLGRCTMGAS